MRLMKPWFYLQDRQFVILQDTLTILHLLLVYEIGAFTELVGLPHPCGGIFEVS